MAGGKSSRELAAGPLRLCVSNALSTQPAVIKWLEAFTWLTTDHPTGWEVFRTFMAPALIALRAARVGRVAPSRSFVIVPVSSGPM